MKAALAVSLLAALTACTDSATGEGGGCGGPPTGWHSPSDGIGDLRPFDTVRVRGDGVMAWNGEPVPAAMLEDNLRRTATEAPTPMVLFSFEAGAQCPAVRSARRILRASAVCRAGLCGEGTGWRHYAGGKIVF
ncbi:hypothetical protein [Sphingomonas sp. KR3-1]|uniref:ExbD/TolR family protein n=1 Tax=Sphingomonas sp. KR3-1 TaxID=3156611 RepID=UPI0032B315C3